MHNEVWGCAEILPWKRKMENFELVPRSENTFFIFITASKFINLLFRKPIVSVIIYIQT